MDFDHLAKIGLSRLGVIKVSTALNPLLWLVGLVVPLAIFTAWLFPEPIVKICALGLAGALVIAAVVVYFILLFRDPNRLQSEAYRLRELEIRTIYRKGEGGRVIIAAGDEPRVEQYPEGHAGGDRR